MNSIQYIRTYASLRAIKESTEKFENFIKFVTKSTIVPRNSDFTKDLSEFKPKFNDNLFQTIS